MPMPNSGSVTSDSGSGSDGYGLECRGVNHELADLLEQEIPAGSACGVTAGFGDVGQRPGELVQIVGDRRRNRDAHRCSYASHFCCVHWFPPGISLVDARLCGQRNRKSTTTITVRHGKEKV